MPCSESPEIELIYATGVPVWFAKESQQYKETSEGFLFKYPAGAAS